MSSSFHAFALPTELLQNITLRSRLPHHTTSESYKVEPQDLPSQTATVHGSRACNVCVGASFQDVEEQRSHFRSDWHRYNVKIRLRGGKPVSEVDFAKLVDSLEDSISGSASDSDGTDSDQSDAVGNLLQRAKISSRPPSPLDSNPAIPQTPLAWFHSPPATQIGVYKALFPLNSDPTSYVDELKSMQRGGGTEGRKWAMFMTAGGHFAGVIVRVSKPEIEEETLQTTKKRLKRERPDTEVLLHKTFHRYTTRRKQGGSQSVNDNAKGPAKSAGALLRRYGEQALRDDIRNLLSDWADDIYQCERIWIRASASNRRIFLDYDDAVITKGDERLRTFPFPTRRPTLSELERCLLELSRVKTSHLTEEALREQDEAYLASLPKPKPKPQVPVSIPVATKAKEPRLSKEEELMRDKWNRLLDMVVHGRLDALKDFWEREGSGLGGIDTRIPSWTGVKVATLLQYATQAGQVAVTDWLLNIERADPTIVDPSEAAPTEQDSLDGDLETSRISRGPHRTAYDLASSRAVRDVFRRSAGAHPEWWDWLGAGRVPSVLRQEMEEEREEKKRVRRKGLKDKIKERESREKEHGSQVEEEVSVPAPEPPTPSQPSNRPRRLGGASGSADAVAGLTPEMRAKVERERRARAAEARLNTLSGR
ncbi:hypothetical protein F5148DRAFT_1170193 [Russula earlei]|uniref:Uncharacterized protein n=1 Tax=Russula earlei TaxID=71964 RepID=A0ACC0UJ21_9AGAM|nr:hypothetical protein F5148DRAFT_1170193 [Russula earlei]